MRNKMSVAGTDGAWPAELLTLRSNAVVSVDTCQWHGAPALVSELGSESKKDVRLPMMGGKLA